MLRSNTWFLGNDISVVLAWEGPGPGVWDPNGNASAPRASCVPDPRAHAACSRAASFLSGDIPGSSGTPGLECPDLAS